MKTEEQLIKELEEIRVRLSQIYMELGNPKYLGADMILRDDIKKFKQHSHKPQGK